MVIRRVKKGKYYDRVPLELKGRMDDVCYIFKAKPNGVLMYVRNRIVRSVGVGRLKFEKKEIRKLLQTFNEVELFGDATYSNLTPINLERVKHELQNGLDFE